MEEKSAAQPHAEMHTESFIDIIASEGDRTTELPLKSGFQLVWELAH